MAADHAGTQHLGPLGLFLGPGVPRHRKTAIRANPSAPQIASSFTSTTPMSGSSNPIPGPFSALFTATRFGLRFISST